MNAATEEPLGATVSHKHSMDRMYRLQRHFYDLTRAYYLLGRDHMLKELSPKPGDKVLEIGCGTGRNLLKAAALYPDAEFFGVDISDEMLKTATAKFAGGKLAKQVSLYQADATTLDLHPALSLHRYDRIYYSYTLSMIPDWQSALTSATSLLSNSGQLHVVDFGPGTRLPKFFNFALRKWLGAFGVTPRDAMQDIIERSSLKPQFMTQVNLLYLGYAIHLVLTRRSTTIV